MRRIALFLTLLGAAAMLTAGYAWAEGEAHAFIGLKKCAMCHKKEATGNQLAKWEASGHAKAFTNLTSEAGKAKAAKLGIADPATDGKCLSCHTTGYGVKAELGAAALLPADGVSCEACHGAGNDYFKKATMEQIHAGTLDGKTVGLSVPTKDVCLTCHKAGNPEHKGVFNYEEALKKIDHSIPKQP